MWTSVLDVLAPVLLQSQPHPSPALKDLPDETLFFRLMSVFVPDSHLENKDAQRTRL